MKKGYIIAAGVVVLILLAVVFLGRGYARYRMNDIGLCKICHELFVPYEDYKGKAPTSAKSVFSVGVGAQNAICSRLKSSRKHRTIRAALRKDPGAMAAMSLIHFYRL